MRITDFKLRYIGKTGTREKNICREDNLFSDRYVRNMTLQHPELGEIYVDYQHWSLDSRVDIFLSPRNTQLYLEGLRGLVISCKSYPKEPYTCLFKLQHPVLGTLKNHTIESLSDIVGEPLTKHLNEKRLKIIRNSRNLSELFVEFKNYSYSDALYLFLLSVLIPYLRQHEITKQAKAESKTKVSPQRPFRERIMVYGFSVFLLLGWYTCVSRERVGAKCNDGTNSYATGSGACSSHGGVRYWKDKYWWEE